MLSLFDIMKQAQNGTAMEAFAKQFGLAQEQATKAMEALIPAFSSGLKRNATNPYDMASLMMASGNYTKYFEDMSHAFTPQGLADGHSALGHIFGSKEAAAAIAAQAEQMTGIGQDVLKSMMPAMADTLMGGIVKQAAEQFQAATKNLGGSNPFAEMMGQWMETARLSEKPKAPSLFDNPFSQSMEAMMGGSAANAAGMQNAFLENPFAKSMADMMAAMANSHGFPNAAPPSGSDSKPAMPDAASHFSSMFDSGVEAQKTYQKSMEAIIETYWKPPVKG